MILNSNIMKRNILLSEKNIFHDMSQRHLNNTAFSEIAV